MCNNSETCTVCKEGYFLTPEGKCSDTCPEDLVENDCAHECEPCNEFVYMKKYCVEKCPVGYGIENHHCVVCPALCDECIDS